MGYGLLHGLPPGLPRGTPLQLEISMDETGLLTVHAKEPMSGREMRFELRIGGMDADAVEAARASVAATGRPCEAEVMRWDCDKP